MIAFLKGRLAHKEATYVILEVNGIGYRVFISLNTYTAIKNEEACTLFTHFHVKEDAQLLYGFTNSAEKQTFQLLISISGVGPNTALMVLSTLSSVELKNAIVSDDVKTIQSVKGIGAKTAQRIILELKDKVIKEGVSPEDNSGVSNNTLKEEALTALVTLGISKNVAEKSVLKILKTADADITVEELIKRVLKSA
jgi:Holliday junction DNA helicase RuvA